MKMTRDWFAFALPISGFVSDICLAAFWLSGDGDSALPHIFEPFLYAKFHHLPEQFPRHRLIVKEMQGAFGMGQLKSSKYANAQ